MADSLLDLSARISASWQRIARVADIYPRARIYVLSRRLLEEQRGVARTTEDLARTRRSIPWLG
jgi:hypothetical protein